MRKLLSLFLVLLLGFTGCDKAPKKSLRVGVDPTFFPLELMGNEPAVLGFINELLQEISRVEKHHIERVNTSWDMLLETLDENKVQGVISSMYPYNFNLNKYNFSDLCLLTGPVLVVPEASYIRNFNTLSGAEVAVLGRENEQLLIDLAPNVIPRLEDNLAKTLNALNEGKYNAAFIDSIPAQGFITDIYNKELKIVTAPAGMAGLRLITKSGQNEQLIKIFNSGLAKLVKSGKYDQLLVKWKL